MIANVNYMNFQIQGQNANLSRWMKSEAPPTHLKDLSRCLKNAIKNAFDNFWFGDQTYGLLGSVPAEMLHVSGTGILKYIFEYLENLIAGDIDKETFDDLHRCLVRDAQRQSERDFPRMSVRNGITDGTKMCGSERVGNCFSLFRTQLGQRLISFSTVI